MTQAISTSTDLELPEYDDLVIPDISNLVIEDDTPVDNLISEKQQRLLTESLYSAQALFKGRSFLASANVGVFYALRRPPLVPDVFLSLDVEPPQAFKEKKNRQQYCPLRLKTLLAHLSRHARTGSLVSLGANFRDGASRTPATARAFR
jgi:hypothetical protein